MFVFPVLNSKYFSQGFVRLFISLRQVGVFLRSYKTRTHLVVIAMEIIRFVNYLREINIFIVFGTKTPKKALFVGQSGILNAVLSTKDIWSHVWDRMLSHQSVIEFLDGVFQHSVLFLLWPVHWSRPKNECDSYANNVQRCVLDATRRIFDYSPLGVTRLHWKVPIPDNRICRLHLVF